MASQLIITPPYEAESSIEVSLKEAFQVLQLQLKPPFSLKIPTQLEYLNLNRAILYGILCEPDMGLVHLKHLHGIVTDGYSFFTSKLVEIANELYPKLVYSVKVQLIWVTSQMICVSAEGIDCLLVSLLRQIVGGDFSEGNLWLCSELIRLFSNKLDVLLEEEPLVVTSALYTFLRLLADHYRISGNSKIDAIKRMEIDFCSKVLKEQFHLCLKIGRDLVRLLQDLVCIPEFRVIWRDLLLKPNNILQLYHTRTSSRYFLLRITPEMETQLRFLLTRVKLGSLKRYQFWFLRKFICSHERETLIIDIVRFVCCSHHPPNEIIMSDITPRWFVVGWLLKSCRKNYVEANVKLALLYDWLFFNENVDNIMNIEPAVLLMVHSITEYVGITHMLLEFLFFLVDNYDVDRKDVVVQGVVSSFKTLVRKGVVRSLDILTGCDKISPLLKERLKDLLASKVHSHPLLLANEIQENPLEKVFRDFREAIRSSTMLGLQMLEKILNLFIDTRVGADFSLSPQDFSCKIAKELGLCGYKLFDLDENIIQSPTMLLIRFFIFSQHEKLQDLLLFWSRNGFLVGPWLLSYASRIAYEEKIMKFHIEKCSNCEQDKESVARFVPDAFEAYKSYLVHRKKDLPKGSDISLPKLLFSDLTPLVEHKMTKKFLKILLCSIYRHLPDLCIGEESIVRILVFHLDDNDVLDIQFQLGLKKLSVFGSNTEDILILIKNSFTWGSAEQYKFWVLIRSELAVSENVQIEKIVLETLCRDEDVNSIAVSGLLSLCGSRAPTPELVAVIMFLPNGNSPNFATAVLANWAVSNPSLLLTSFTEILEKLKNSESNGIMLNDSAFLWLLNYLDAKGLEGANILSKFTVNSLHSKSYHPNCNQT